MNEAPWRPLEGSRSSADKERLLKMSKVAASSPRKRQAQVSYRKALQLKDKSLVSFEPGQSEQEPLGTTPRELWQAKSHRTKYC